MDKMQSEEHVADVDMEKIGELGWSVHRAIGQLKAAESTISCVRFGGVEPDQVRRWLYVIQQLMTFSHEYMASAEACLSEVMKDVGMTEKCPDA